MHQINAAAQQNNEHGHGRSISIPIIFVAVIVFYHHLSHFVSFPLFEGEWRSGQSSGQFSQCIPSPLEFVYCVWPIIIHFICERTLQPRQACVVVSQKGHVYFSSSLSRHKSIRWGSFEWISGWWWWWLVCAICSGRLPFGSSWEWIGIILAPFNSSIPDPPNALSLVKSGFFYFD